MQEYIRHWMMIDIADEHACWISHWTWRGEYQEDGYGGYLIVFLFDYIFLCLLSGATITISVRGDFVPGTSNR